MVTIMKYIFTTNITPVHYATATTIYSSSSSTFGKCLMYGVESTSHVRQNGSLQHRVVSQRTLESTTEQKIGSVSETTQAETMSLEQVKHNPPKRSEAPA